LAIIVTKTFVDKQLLLDVFKYFIFGSSSPPKNHFPYQSCYFFTTIHLTYKQFLMQKFYSAPGFGRLSTIAKIFLTTVLSLLFFSLTQVKAQAGTNLSYDGTDDYVTLGPNVLQNVTGSYTFEGWVLWRGDAGFGTTWQRIFDIGSSTSNWVALTVDDGSGKPLFGLQVNANPLQTLTATTAIPLNTWTHIAVTVDDATDIATIYINGVASGSSGAVFIDHLSDMGATSNNWLGKSEFVADPYFNGQIDEFRISNSVRYTSNFTPSTVQFSTDGSTVALYHFNEGSGTTTADATGNFNATLAASPSTPTWVTNSILPIKLNSISATLVDGAVDIKWSASLDRESEFIIERSSNGSNFSSVGSIKRSTGTNGFESFNFRDNKPLSGRSYYRLKCTEVGSSSFYSRMVAIVISAKEDFVVYPNPVKANFITVEFPKAYTGNIGFTLSSTSGAIVLRQELNAVERKEFQIPKNTLIVPGVYVLEINTDGIKRSKMIVYQ
jgi:hypothetical protein